MNNPISTSPGGPGSGTGGPAPQSGGVTPANARKGKGSAARLTVWFICSFVLAIMAPALNGFKGTLLSPVSASSQETWRSFMTAATGQGEFLLIAAALAGGIIGEMLGVAHESLKGTAQVIGAVALAIFAGSVYLFAIAATLVARYPVAPLGFLAAALVISLWGVTIASWDRELHG